MKKKTKEEIEKQNLETMFNCPFPDINSFSGICNRCGKQHNIILDNGKH